jgi:two-component system, OmpR family, response regulator
MCPMPRSWHVLIVDDDRELRDLVGRFLTEHGFRVSYAADGKAMARTLIDGEIDLIILDLMLPEEDGFSLCRKLRASHSIPIIILTAVSGEADRIVGLELGADDYIAKPFNPRELVARAKAVLRRTHAMPPKLAAPRTAAYRFDGWTILLASRELRSPEGALVPLSDGEFDLLVAFAEHPQRTLNRDQILDLTRGRSTVLFDRSIDVQVSRLRRKIEPNPDAPTIIKTVRNGGYVFTSAVDPLGSSAAAPGQP